MPFAERELTVGMTDSIDSEAPQTPYLWVAPLISTLLTIPASVIGFFFAMFSAMMCDSCNGAESEKFDQTYGVALVVFSLILLVALGMLIASWVLQWLASTPARSLPYAFAAPACVVIGWFLFSVVVSAAGPGT